MNVEYFEFLYKMCSVIVKNYSKFSTIVSNSKHYLQEGLEIFKVYCKTTHMLYTDCIDKQKELSEELINKLKQALEEYFNINQLGLVYEDDKRQQLLVNIK